MARVRFYALMFATLFTVAMCNLPPTYN